uniref:Uncharacterized protein n=1 Tax=Panagrolaimus sp. ES5 TaxID=591445 RepID=A0AC34F5N2_9BILA
MFNYFTSQPVADRNVAVEIADEEDPQQHHEEEFVEVPIRIATEQFRYYQIGIGALVVIALAQAASALKYLF